MVDQWSVLMKLCVVEVAVILVEMALLPLWMVLYSRPRRHYPQLILARHQTKTGAEASQVGLGSLQGHREWLLMLKYLSHSRNL